MRAWQYRMGGAFGIYVRAGDVTIYHNGSADLIDAELDRPADVLLAGIAGYRGTPRYLERLIGRLRPGTVIPSHHDAFFSPLEAGAHLLPGIDIDEFVEGVRRLAPAAQIVMPLYDDTISIDRATRAASL
jgi:L-ascorbate metabolism protein UlaG (beta-lactamase superfamily)